MELKLNEVTSLEYLRIGITDLIAVTTHFDGKRTTQVSASSSRYHALLNLRSMVARQLW